MPKTKLDFRPRHGAQDPLFLDFVASHPADRQRPAGPATLDAEHPTDATEPPLFLDHVGREPRRGTRAVPALLVGALLLVATAVGLFLAARSIPHDRPAALATQTNAAAVPAPAASGQALDENLR